MGRRRTDRQAATNGSGGGGNGDGDGTVSDGDGMMVFDGPRNV